MSAPLFGKVTSPPNRGMIHYRVTVYIYLLTYTDSFVTHNLQRNKYYIFYASFLYLSHLPPHLPLPEQWTPLNRKSELRTQTRNLKRFLGSPRRRTNLRPTARSPAKNSPR